jgi:tetratricopeptide (TPR) repeat protein
MRRQFYKRRPARWARALARHTSARARRRQRAERRRALARQTNNTPILAGMAAPHAPAGETAGAAGSDQPLYGSRAIRDLYPGLREDRLRYLERWGVIRPVRVAAGERFYAFADLAALRQASAELAKGVPFRTVVRDLRTMRQRQLQTTPGAQLSFDFQPTRETAPAKVIALGPRIVPAGGPQRSDEPGRLPPSASPAATTDPQRLARAAALFAEAAALDTGDPAHDEAVMAAYRQAAVLDPAMTAAIVNLANIHYARDRAVEAEALYEKALALDPSGFEAQYNLGNVLHDSGRFEAAARCYTGALAIEPTYADAHFYLAVTLEKLGRSPEAKVHWVAYRRLAPHGEWVELAREFSE